MATNVTVCPKPMAATSNGAFQNENPLDYALPLAILQICIVLVLTRTLAFLLRPLRQPRVIAEMVGGILLGPSAFGKYKPFSHTVFPPKSLTVMDTLANFGLLFFLFLVGLELDLKSLQKSGKKVVSIAIAGISIPFILGIGTSLVLRETISKGVSGPPFLVFMGVALSITAFPVLARILAELKLLTTELGSIAMSAAAINDVAAWILLALAIALSGNKTSPLTPLWVLLCGAAFVTMCVFLVAPIFRWVCKRCPSGEPVKEIYICGILGAILAAAFVTDAIGIHALFGAFVLGVLVPNEGPLASALVEKLEDLVSGLLLPLYFASSGLKTDLFTIQGGRSWALLLLVIVTACAGKIVGTVGVSLSFKMPFKEALALGFLMNSKGLVELIVLNIGKDRKVLNDQTFAIMVLMALFTTFITTPLVMAVYEPAKRILHSYKHRTIQRKNLGTQLRILACFHSQRNIPTMINLIEASRGTEKKEALSVYAMHLMEFSERSSAIRMVHKARKNGLPFWNKGIESDSNQVVVAFEAYQQLSCVSVRPMTAISHLSDIHVDICSSAEDKRAAIIILPFHKHQRIDGLLETTCHDYRGVNRKVLESAPCSVAILIDRGLGGPSHVAASNVASVITVLFFGGPDDREALALARRMAEHPGITVDVVHFKGGASVILDERAEHERMADAYAMMNERLHQSLSEQAKLEKIIEGLKADLRRRERDYNLTQKEIEDLQKQVTILLKECRDIQLRCGSAGTVHPETDVASLEMNVNAEGNAETVISEHLISFHGINGLVEQNVKLRSLVRSLSFQIENKENELKEQFEVELEKHSQEAASKVSIVLERAQQQERMIDSLHSSVAMYKRLYDEEHKLRSSDPQTLPLQASGRVDQVLLLESSQNSAKQVQEQFTQRVRSLEEELTTLRSENASLRVERDKYLLETNFSQEKLERYVKDMEYQRKEMNEVLSRNVEFQRLIVDYQNQMRESSQSLLAAEELSRKLTMEVSILTREKDLLQNAERRACDEVRDLSMRVHRLQASLDTVHTTEQVHEEARSAERKKLEEHAKHIEREWAEAKKALQVERDNSRVLSLDRDKLIADAMRQIEEMRKELASALQSATAAETRAAASEARCSDLERNLNTKTYDKDGEVEDVSSSASEIMRDLSMAKEEIERLKLELQSNKDHMIQYKKIAEVNEAALKQMESSFELFRSEADNRKNLLEEEISSLRERIFQLQNESSLRSDEASSAATERDAAFASLQLEITELKDAVSTKTSQIVLMEVQISSLKTDLEKEHQKWRAAQENYERQVILQGETIQELTKTSEALALLQEESSELRKLVDAYKSENDELKAKWAMEKSELERCKVEAENKYNEINEQNKLLHNRLDAMHIKAAEGHRQMAGITSAATSSESESDSGLHTVISYLRRSKEIAETEITLLKQEKLRLQSQLERALKDAEAAQASLSEERANARTLVFSEAEFKSLQLQVGEMNLLRESNRQLRAENEQLVKDCKSLREDFHKEKVKIDNLMTLLREKEMVAETLRKEIDAEREEKENSQKRISELLEKSKNIDFEKLKDDFQQMQVKMQEKEGEMEKIRSSLSEKEEIISKLKHELAGARNELIEKENHVSQFEANLKADLQKKFNLQLKRRVDLHLKEKEALLKEKESAVKEKESLLMEKESLCKEKEEKGKEIEGLLKQLEEKKQETKATGDVDYHTLVNEKDKRIQTLERVIEKEREEKRKEKEKRVNIEKVIQSKVSSVDQERKKFEDELEKDKEAVKRISDELDKLRHARDSLPEGTAVVQLLSSNVLDDRASAYVSAIESFEKAAHSVIVEHGVHTNSSTPVTDMSTLTGGPVAPAPVLAPSSSMASPARLQQKTVDDREKKTIAPKNNVEIRKPARKLVRPRLVKSEEPQGDSEMAETEGKPGPSTDTETRKRIAVSSASELHDESLQQALKRPKSMEPPQKDTIQAHSRLENVETPAAASEDVPDVSTDFPEGFTEDITDLKKDDTDLEEHKESHPSEETQILYDDDTNMTENPDKVVECELSQPAGDMEEGEVSELSSGADGGGEETPNNNELEELQPETDASPLRTDDEEQSEDVNEMTPPEELNGEKNEEGETTEDTITEDVNDGDQVTGESEQINETTVVVAEATNVDNTVSKEGSQAMSSAAATSSTTINLNVRAKEMAARRLALPQRPATTQSPASISPATRGRGRVPTRARGRALRGGRRAPPGDRN